MGKRNRVFAAVVLQAELTPSRSKRSFARIPLDLRTRIRFRSVNCKGQADYLPERQRHHLLPRQLLSDRNFSSMFEELGSDAIAFDDFRANGLLLPSTAACSVRTGLPLHRGPHKLYNEVVIHRVGRIHSDWRRTRFYDHQKACVDALARLRWLQSALRRRLLRGQGRNPVILNRKDPIGTGYDFSELDAMAEAIWCDTSRQP